MASEKSPSKSNPSILHHFIISNSVPYQYQHFHAYGTDSISNSPLSIQCLGERMSRSVDLIHATSISDESNSSHDRHLMDLLGTSNEAAHQAQRLSLSLGSVSCRERSFNSNLISPHSLISHEETTKEPCNTELYRVMNDYSFAGTTFASQSQYCSTSYGTESFATAVGSSRYLKPAQSLLEEIVGVGGNDIDTSNKKYVEKLSCTSRKGSFRLFSELKTQFSNNELLSEKHGTCVNLLKLLAMIEEVERRYEQYYHHMKELVSSFETVAGLEAGKSYTALALHAMSKHFYSLRNSILTQIRATKQKIVKDRPKISSRLSQLSLLNQESRHNRISIQQLGIMQSSGQAWRPIRGLPDTSVMMLRAWLFEHFLNPSALSIPCSIISNFVNSYIVARYPSDSEKLMLASQTGLSKNQVCNWFINARVRLWKPMIEEMYNEEFAESSTESDQFMTSSSITREGVEEDLN